MPADRVTQTEALASPHAPERTGYRQYANALIGAAFVVAVLHASPVRAAGPPPVPPLAALIAAAFADVTTLVIVPAVGPTVAPVLAPLVTSDSQTDVVTPLHVDVTTTRLTGDPAGEDLTNNAAISNTGTAEAEIITGGLLGLNINGLFGTADEGVTANADITGIGLGGGVNYLTNGGAVTAIANANAKSGNIDINLVEFEKVDANILATAIATGIAGGAFQDVILNNALVTATANATAAHIDGELNLLNTTSGEMNVAAQSTAIGIDGKAGDDVIINTSTINATADSDTDLTSITLTVGDAAITDLSVFEADGGVSPISEATAVGIQGGAGHDVAINSGTINATANVAVDSFGLGVTGFGVPDASTIAGIFNADPQVDAATVAEATAIGIDGGAGHDRLANSGTINATAVSDATNTGITIAMPVPNLPIPLSFLPGFNIVGAGTGDEATAYGMSSGDGSDFIGNEGDVTATATSNSLAVSVAVELPDLLSSESDDPTFSTSFQIVDAATQSDAIATALFGGKGNDTLNNLAGTLTAAATSTSQTTAVSVILTEGGTGFTGRLNAARTSVVSTATATGMDGGDGNDMMSNSGTLINVDADAGANSVIVKATLTYADDKGSALVSVSGVSSETEATANAIGMDGGDGNDQVTNNNAIDADSVSAAKTVVVDVAITFNKDIGLAAGVQLLDTSVTSNATAEGLRGGLGNDTLVNTATINADATADARGTVVALGIAGSWDKGASIAVSVADTSTNANADSIGISGGAGDDGITNTATLTANTKAHANSLGVSVTIAATKSTGFAAGVSALRTGAYADAESYGIAGGDGADTIFNQAKITALADAEADADSVGVAVSFTKTGASLGVALVDAQTMATAAAAGIVGDILDQIVSSGELDVTAKADASSNAVSTSFAITSSAGLSGGAALSKAGTVADATATGIIGGGLADTQTATGTSDILADANTASVEVAVSVSGTKTGVALGVSLIDTAAVGTATATGLSGNEGEDILTNTGTLNVTADTDSSSTGISVSITAAMKAGVSAGAALGRATSEAHAIATGIEGGADNDTIGNTGTVNSTSTADSTSDVLTVALSGTATGVSLAAALSDTSAIAEAITKGLYGGWGDDIISSTNAINANSTANADATVVGVTIGVAATGVAAGVSMARSKAEASADAVGIDGGHGSDTITTSGTIDSTATANADGLSVAVVITASAKGASAGAAFTDVGVSADATATGIAGGDEVGAPDTPGDDIMNNAVINSSATANVTGTSVSISASISFVPLGFTQVNAAADATATSTGIDGGLGADLIANMNNVTANALAGVFGTSIGVTPAIGATLGDLTANADATATGIDGGDGEDEILNTGNVAANATATGTGIVIGIGMAGGALTDGSTSSTATATGIDGGADDDVIDNQGNVDAVSLASVTGVSVSATLSAGAALSDLSTNADATSTGIEGGAGDDQITNSQNVTAKATSSGVGVSVSAAITGAALSDASTNATSTATGIGGGTGIDVIDNQGIIDTDAISTVTGVTVSVAPTGASLSDGTSTAKATATGVDGGDDADKILNQNTINADAKATATGVSISVTVTGAALSDLATEANAMTTGVAGGGGNDIVDNRNTINAGSKATVTGVSVGIVGIGASMGDASSNALATTYGIGGGDGDDMITNSAALNVTADADGKGVSVSIAAAGAAFADGTTTTTASATGIGGDAGEDTIVNSDTITLTADADTTGVSVTVTAIGAAIADAATSANAAITGISGGADNDSVLNQGTITGTATGKATATSVSVTGVGVSMGDLSTTSRAIAMGIEGNAGDDRLDNAGTIDIDAKAVGGSTSVGVVLVGGALTTDLATIADAIATGMAGGTGRDTLINSATINILADADSDATAVSVGLVGGALSGGGTRSEAKAVGFDGGDEKDIIVNSGNLTANATSRAKANSVSVSLAGYAATEGALSSKSTVYGVAAGDGDDEVMNDGTMTLTATATTDVDGTTVLIAGGADNSPKSDAAALGIGLYGGAGNNMLFNRGTVTLGTTANMTMNNSGFTFAGSSNSDGFLEANVEAVGMRAEDGDDLLSNDDTLTITATANLTSSGGSTAAFGSSSAGDSTLAVASAFGLDGGDGANMFVNTDTATMTVTAATNINANNSAYTFGGGSNTDSVLTSRSNAVGISGGSGIDMVAVGGVLDVNSTADLISSGNSNTTFGGTKSVAGMSAQTTGGGIETGGAADIVVITGTVDVDIVANGNVNNVAGVGVGLFSDATAESTVSILGSGFGISLGEGNNQLTNSGSVTVNVGGTAVMQGLLMATRPQGQPRPPTTFLLWASPLAMATTLLSMTATCLSQLNPWRIRFLARRMAMDLVATV